MSDNVREGIVRELFKPARRKYPRTKVQVLGLWETLSADLMDMQKWAKQNDNHRYILTCLDNFSKYAWAIPVKSKSGPDVTAAMAKILDEGHPVKNLHTDEGKEFFNKDFGALLRKHKVRLYHTYSGIKSGIAERFNRTLRHLMEPELLLQGNRRWLELLPTLVDRYNRSMRHRTIGMTPIEATDPAKEEEILRKVYRKTKIVTGDPKFKVGDHVRVSKSKLLFEPGYTANYSMEIFRVARVKLSNPRTYLLEDLEGQPIQGRFYEEELAATRYPDQYLIEKVVKKKGSKMLVKYLGFDKLHWINKQDIV